MFMKFSEPNGIKLKKDAIPYGCIIGFFQIKKHTQYHCLLWKAYRTSFESMDQW